MSRPEEKLIESGCIREVLTIRLITKPSGEMLQVGHIDCKISSNMKCIALNALKRPNQKSEESTGDSKTRKGWRKNTL